jgi:hypothetical protein
MFRIGQVPAPDGLPNGLSADAEPFSGFLDSEFDSHGQQYATAQPFRSGGSFRPER